MNYQLYIRHLVDLMGNLSACIYDVDSIWRSRVLSNGTSARSWSADELHRQFAKNGRRSWSAVAYGTARCDFITTAPAKA